MVSSPQDPISNLPTEILLEVACRLSVHDLNNLAKVNRNLNNILMPELPNSRDDYGNDRYLFHLIKTGNMTEVAAWPGTPSTTLFNLAGQFLANYQQTANTSVRDRMLHLRHPYGVCLRIDKSGLMVAVDHGQWELAAFLLRRDGGDVGFLGTREHFFYETITLPPAVQTLPTGYILVWKPPMWEQFNESGRYWEAYSFQGGTSRDIRRLLEICQRHIDQHTTVEEIIDGSE
ncbi:uncharacterized protein PG998_011847 [Apiospora kogelbergensis]|uniref:uncharacterized protein n=1 Tax=Apiospora kogelbergensis TaxID=1337665 RepID=UPI00312DE255